MASGEYLTISEFAERVGTSTQAIYQRMATNLKPYVKLIKGKKHLHAKALSLFIDQGVDNSDNNESAETNKPFNDVLVAMRGMIDTLTAQLAAKDAQLAERDKNITDLLARLEQAQQLLHQSQLLEGQKLLEPPKRHWWQFGKAGE